MITCTYSPEDNKCRIYSSSRLDSETFARVKAAGFMWAPKQGLFVAPSWSPSREDLMIELSDSGEIDDEDYSVTERAADRAERFEGYREKRTAEAIGHADHFEAGPSVFGHQNQARAERQAARHDRVRGHACSQWRKAEYWRDRTERVIANALYKSDPKVRRGRIKKLEAELRAVVAKYTPTDNPPHIINQRSYNYATGEYRFNGDAVPHVWCGPKGRGGTWVECSELESMKAASSRWIDHYEMRLTYERTMLANEGGSAADVDMEAGGWIGGRQIQSVTRSPVTKKVVSVKLFCQSTGFTAESDYTKQETKTVLRSVNIERLGAEAYRAPTDEERAAFATATAARKSAEKAAKPVAAPLINPTDDDAQKLQDIWNEAEKQRSGRRYDGPSEVLRMTQAEYSRYSKGDYARCKTVSMKETLSERGRVEVFKVRKSSRNSFYAASRVVILTDKPQKPIPWDAVNAALATMPTEDTMRQHLPRLVQIVGNWHAAITDDDRKIVQDAVYVGWVHSQSATQSEWTEKGAAVLQSIRDNSPNKILDFANA